MSAASPIERIAARGAPPPAGGAAWAQRRQRALASLVAKGLPDRRDENWKYLDHARIAGFAFESAPQGEADATALAERLLPLGSARRVVLVDGRFAPGLSDSELRRDSRSSISRHARARTGGVVRPAPRTGR